VSTRAAPRHRQQGRSILEAGTRNLRRWWALRRLQHSPLSGKRNAGVSQCKVEMLSASASTLFAARGVHIDEGRHRPRECCFQAASRPSSRDKPRILLQLVKEDYAPCCGHRLPRTSSLLCNGMPPVILEFARPCIYVGNMLQAPGVRNRHLSFRHTGVWCSQLREVNTVGYLTRGQTAVCNRLCDAL
jgi:hypothetical protein